MSKQQWYFDFSVSFWAGLWTALIGGLIVGVAIFYFQIMKEKRDEAKVAERGFLGFLDKIRWSLSKDPKIVLSDADPSMYLTRGISQTLKSIEEEAEISFWSEHIHKRNEKVHTILGLFAEIREADVKFQNASYSLQSDVVHLLDQKGIHRQINLYQQRYIYCKINKIPWGIMGLGNGDPSSYEFYDTEFIHNPDYEEVIDEYNNSREKVFELITLLVGVLNGFYGRNND